MRPTAAPAYFPYAHRTMAEVMADEAPKSYRPYRSHYKAPAKPRKLTERQLRWLAATPWFDFWPARNIAEDARKFAGFASVRHDLFERRQHPSTYMLEYRLSEAGRRIAPCGGEAA